jgi:hypothetical protein
MKRKREDLRKDLALPNSERNPATPKCYDREQFAMTRNQIQHLDKRVAERVNEALEALGCVMSIENKIDQMLRLIRSCIRL